MGRFSLLGKEDSRFFHFHLYTYFRVFRGLGRGLNSFKQYKLERYFLCVIVFILFQEEDQQFRYIALELCEATLQEVTFY